jgi:hypothetical protein
MPTAGTIEVGQMPADQLLATFTLSKGDLQRVKRRTTPCTSLAATLGLVQSR